MSEQNKGEKEQASDQPENIVHDQEQQKEESIIQNTGNVNMMINEENNHSNLQEELALMGFEMELILEALKITQDKDKAIEYIIGSIEDKEKLESKNKTKINMEENKNEADDSGFEDDDDEDYKIIFLVRMDLKMGLGKIAAQVAHATLKAYKQMEAKADKNEIDEVNFFEWLENGQKKIVVKVNTEDELLSTLEKAKMAGLNCCSIRDAGLTQIASGSLTVGAIGPAPGGEIDALTKQFKLL